MSSPIAMQSEYEFSTLYQEAQTRWLKPPEVLFILQNYERLTLTHTVPQRPTSGSLFLFNKKVLRFFRKDGHQWRRKKDGRAIAEAHERLKVGNAEALSCYYAHGEHDPTFQRRIYWMLDPEYEHIVLVQYRDVSIPKEVTSPISHIFSGSGSNTGIDGGKFEAVYVGGRDPFEDWKAFFEFLKNRQPPRSLSDFTANDAVEFLRHFPLDKVEAVFRSVSGETFKRFLGSHKEDPFDSKIVRTFLMELAEEQTSQKELVKKILSHDNKEDLFEMRLKTKDVDNVDSLVIPNEDARNYFPFINYQGGTESFIRFEDEDGKEWLFGYSYHNIGNRCEFTRGWSRYVKEKQLSAGDSVFFQRHRMDSSKFFIGYRKRDAGAAPGNDTHEPSQTAVSAVLNPTSSATSDKKLKHNIPVCEHILVISCGDNQDSEETYFISCIFNELCLRGFAPFRFDIARSTITANQEILYPSRVGIMIFSKNYACSRQCLDEVVAIMDHFEANDLVLIPVYFKVNLSDIRNQSGSLGRAFLQLGNSVGASQFQKWRVAMIKITSTNGYLYMKGDEVMLAQNIARDVYWLLSSESNEIKLPLESILPLLDCPQPSAPQIVGLWGMAGIGKTTIAREIFRTQAERYDVSYFLPDFHQMCQTKGLSHLRDEFFSEICGEEKVFIDTCDAKLSFTKNRFHHKKVLIVLDGVSNAIDAEILVGGFGWFSGGHTIMLTSRNRQVLVQCRAKELYEIPKLSVSESYHFCRLYAPEKYWKRRMSLISELVNYASGIPLALQVLVSSVQKQRIRNEKEHLRRLRQHLPIEIQDAFRRSFDGLGDNEKNIFLDLACFFRGENKDHVVNILDGCGFFTDLGIYALIDESLISLVDNKIEIPNIFQDMGQFVACQENKEAGKRSRLWESNNIVDVLKNNLGTEAIEGIFLDVSGLTFELNPTVFERMYRLRLLKLHYLTSENYCKLRLPQGLYSLPDELRLLHWERYPLGSLPWNFNPRNLVELNMPYSNLTKLWKGTKNLEKLKRIILSHSRQLVKFPRLSKARNLEHIDLEGCTSLVKVNSSIIHHHKLTFLSLKDCSHLRIMPTTVQLESLEVLNLSGCSELADFHGFSPNLKELYLAGTAITAMPSSIRDLTRLVTLDLVHLDNCNRLQHRPLEISNLQAVATLSSKHPASSMDSRDLSSVEHTAPPYKKYRLKTIIKIVIMSLRKRKREKSVSRATNLSEIQLGSASTSGNDPSYKSLWGFHVLPERPGEPECPYYMQAGDCNFGNMCKFHHPRERETHVPESSLSSIGLPIRTGEPVCGVYFHTGNCSSGPTCIFDHPMLVSTHMNTSYMPSETPHSNLLRFSSSIGDSSSELVERSTKKPIINKNTPSMASETQHSNMLRFSSSIGDSSSELVERSTKKPIIHKNTPSTASETQRSNMLRFSSSIGDSSSELVERSTKKPIIHENAPSMASETPQLHRLGRSSSLGALPGELVEASTVSEITQETVGRDTIDLWEFNDADPDYWWHHF